MISNIKVKMTHISTWQIVIKSENNCNTASGKDYSMIDHVLVTSAIKKNIFDVFFYHGYKEYCGKYNSDHYPVVVDLYF